MKARERLCVCVCVRERERGIDSVRKTNYNNRKIGEFFLILSCKSNTLLGLGRSDKRWQAEIFLGKKLLFTFDVVSVLLQNPFFFITCQFMRKNFHLKIWKYNIPSFRWGTFQRWVFSHIWLRYILLSSLRRFCKKNLKIFEEGQTLF